MILNANDICELYENSEIAFLEISMCKRNYELRVLFFNLRF